MANKPEREQKIAGARTSPLCAYFFELESNRRHKLLADQLGGVFAEFHRLGDLFDTKINHHRVGVAVDDAHILAHSILAFFVRL